ncbi:MAG: restriction endonuclease, partial [Firmicutes bacterium]|nr:restriction endonuclease [Bacillota bacterium]
MAASREKTGKTVDSQWKGEQLEAALADFFAAHQYQVQRNVVLAGTSGGRHEIDVLATKDDTVAQFSVAVECKAWDAPIEKDVVSKLAYIMADIHCEKGIIATLSGWRLGAEQAAKQLGIELWGPNELAEKLPKLSVTDAPARNFSAQGIVPAMRLEVVYTKLHAKTGGFLGMGRAKVVWEGGVYLPFYLIKMQAAYEKKRWWGQRGLQSQTRWNSYDGLEGALYRYEAQAPVFQELPPSELMNPYVKSKVLQETIRRAHEKWRTAVQPAAQERARKKLAT